MGSLLSRNKIQDDGYSSLYGGYPAVSTNVGSCTSYPTRTWISTPSVRSAADVHSIKRPSRSYYSPGGSIATSYDTRGAVNSASSERYGHADIKPTSYKPCNLATVESKSNWTNVTPVKRAVGERNYTSTVCSVKPSLSKSHVDYKYRSTSTNFHSSAGSYPTDNWSSGSPRSSSTIDRTSTKATKGFSADGGKTKRYSLDCAVHLASNKKPYAYPYSPKSYTAVASARSAAERNRNSSTSSVKPMEPKRHVPGKYKSASTRQNRSCDSNRNPGDYSRRIATYGARGGGRVVISVPLNPWQVLGLHSSDVSPEATKAAFKMKINQPVRQNRAMVSIAHHMLTSSAGRYRRIEGKEDRKSVV